MARISTYALDEKITGGDKWIGSDSGFYNKTKNFTPLKLADYFNSSEKIDSTNSLRFWYQTLDFQEDRSFGTISFENEIGASVSFSSITSFLLSKKTEGNIFVYDFLSSLIDSKVLLHQGNTMNLYAIYEVTNIEEYELDSNFIKVDVSFIRGNGSLIEDLSYLLSVVDFALEASLNWGNIEGNISDQTDLQEALDLKVDISSLGDVAFSNDYNDLDNKPTIPTNTSDLINNGEDGINPFITLNDIPPVEGFVPYTGATQNVDLGEFELRAGQIEFDTTPTGNAGVGIMRWNDSDGTLDLGLKGGNVTLQVGQEQVVRVVNKTGSNLLESNYQAVRVNGAQGQRLKVALAQATNDLLSAETIGLVTENIDNNQEGFVTTSGLIRGINTTGSLQGETWADGDMLYLSPSVAGRITNIKPSAPNHLIVVGYVVHSHANNGSIFVKVDNGYELEELHNVTETNYTTPIDADSLLTFDITNSLWKRLSWTNIKSNLKTYFDTIYQTALGFTPENVANKANDLTSPDNTKYPTTLAVSTALNSKQDTLTNPITGTGTTNYLPKFTGSSTLGNSNIFNDGTNVVIGSTTARARLDVRAQGTLATDIAFRVRNSADTADMIIVRGNGDVFIGFEAGKLTTVGGNTIMGNSALRVNTSGYNNTAFGFGALFQNTTGFSNTAVGLQSLYSNTTGTNNTALGIQSLNQLTSGNSNLALGASSAQKISDGNNLTSSTNSIFIGRDTRANANNQTNQIVIGDQAIGLGSNTVVLGNDSIVTTALKGNVGIGTTSPSTNLHVLGNSFSVNPSARITHNPGFSPEFIELSAGAFDGGGIVNVGSTSSIIFKRDGNESMRINGSGNVGIGTSNPLAKLHVAGTSALVSDFANIDVTNDAIYMGGKNYSGMYLEDGVASFGHSPGGDFRGVRANYTEGVWFINESGCKLGLQPVDNNLWSEGNIIQTTDVPSNTTTPAAWVKIYNNDNSSFYFMPVYQ